MARVDDIHDLPQKLADERERLQHAVNEGDISETDAGVRNQTGCTVVAVERDGSVVTNPGTSFVIERDDELVVAGIDESITRFQTEFV